MAFEDQRTTVYKINPERPESETLPTLRTEELLLNMGPQHPSTQIPRRHLAKACSCTPSGLRPSNPCRLGRKSSTHDPAWVGLTLTAERHRAAAQTETSRHPQSGLDLHLRGGGLQPGTAEETDPIQSAA